MSILQTILQDEKTPEPALSLFMNPSKKLLWEGIAEKDLQKVEQSIHLNGGVPFTSNDVLEACVNSFDSQICERLFPKHQVHPLDQDDAILLLKSAETTQAFLPSLVALSNKLIIEKGYLDSNFFNIFYWANENLALVLQDPRCNVLQNLQKHNEEKNFLKWAVRSCQPSLLKAANIELSKYVTNLQYYSLSFELQYNLPNFKTLEDLSHCQQLWEQKPLQDQEVIQQLLAPMNDLFPVSFGGDPWLTACVLPKVHIMAQMLSSVEGCKYLQKMVDTSYELGCHEKIVDTLSHTMRFETDLEEQMTFEEYTQLFKIFGKCKGSQGESFGLKLLLNAHAFHQKLVTEDKCQRNNKYNDDDEEEKKGAYEDDDFFMLLRAAVYWCEDDVVKVMDNYEKTWKSAALKIIYEKHVGGLGCENPRRKM